MALVTYDRVQETGTANTTVSFTLTGAITGYQSFSVVGNGNTTYYGATDGTNWEVGLGTYSTTGPTLTRTTIYASSNAGSAVTFSGTVSIFLTYPSERAVYLADNGTLTVPTLTSKTFTLQDVTDPTKQATFSMSGITTGTTRTYTLPDVTGSLATLGNIPQTFAGAIQVNSNLTATASIFMNGFTTATYSFGNNVTTGTIDIGGASQTGTITLGKSTVSQTTNIQAGATASGSTKTLNIGTGGLAGSTTAIAIGSTTGTSTTTLNGAVTLATALPIASGGTNSTATPTLGGVIVGTGTAYSSTAAGTSGQVLTSNGAAAPTWQAASASTGRLLNIQYFTTAGTATYTPTSGTNFVVVEVVGGGGSGCLDASTAGGGTAGGYARKKITSSFSGVTVTVGAGGASQTTSGAAGNAGGTSSFGALVSATGGVGGLRVAGNPSGGSGSNGDINALGGGSVANAKSQGGSTMYGFGTSYSSTSSTNAVYGGGSGGAAATSSGTGGAGLVIVYEYA